MIRFKHLIYALVLGIALGVCASVLFVSSSRKDVIKQLNWNDTINQLNTELILSKQIREQQERDIDSLLRMAQSEGVKFDSIQKVIETYRYESKREIKGVRYWNDARRDSFWRIESTR